MDGDDAANDDDDEDHDGDEVGVDDDDGDDGSGGVVDPRSLPFGAIGSPPPGASEGGFRIGSPGAGGAGGYAMNGGGYDAPSPYAAQGDDGDGGGIGDLLDDPAGSEDGEIIPDSRSTTPAQPESKSFDDHNGKSKKRKLDFGTPAAVGSKASPPASGSKAGKVGTQTPMGANGRPAKTPVSKSRKVCLV